MLRYLTGMTVVFAVTLLAAGFAHPGTAAAPSMPPHTAFTIQSALLSETRHINVYIAPGCETASSAGCPVLYMPDGGVQEDFPHVATDVDAAIRAGQMRPMIVIGIENTSRRRDMTGPTSVASDKAIAPRVGGAAAFRSFIAEELMPEVRRRYRTNGHTAIVGESLAGLFVVETFFAQPQLFDTYIALSPSLWWNDQALVRDAVAKLQAWPDLKRTLYFASAGDDDIGNAIAALQAALQTTHPRGLTWYYQPRPDLRHRNIYRRLSPSVFRKLFPPESSAGKPPENDRVTALFDGQRRGARLD